MMTLRLAFFLAIRTLFRSRERFFPLLSLVSFSGITLSVMAILIVLGVMQGFERELTERWLRLNSHIRITGISSDFFLPPHPKIKEVRPFVEGEAIVETDFAGVHQTKGMKIRGVHSEQVRIGQGVIGELGLVPGLQDQITLFYPFGEVGPTGTMIPRRISLTVDDYFYSGLYEWDHHVLFVPLSKAQTLFGEQAETGLDVTLHSLFDVEEVRQELQPLLPMGAKLATFIEQNARLYSALKLERIGMIFLLSLFGLIASASFVGLLFLLLTAKRRDWAILRAVGLAKHRALQLFWSLGLLFGSGGIVAGFVLGILGLLLLQGFPVPLPQAYYLDFLPVSLQLKTLIPLLAGSIVVLVAGSCYPVLRIVRLPLLAPLREE